MPQLSTAKAFAALLAASAAGAPALALAGGTAGPADLVIAFPRSTQTARVPAPQRSQSRRGLSPQALNAAHALTRIPVLAAQPFVLEGPPSERERAVQCLTAAVHYEAANEPVQGQEAVAQVVLNRARHPAYPKSVCGVVFQGSERRTGCQFTFTCDGSLNRPATAAAWTRARQVAERALNGEVAASVGTALNYHAVYVRPSWSSGLDKVARIGLHVFYRWPGQADPARVLVASAAAGAPSPRLLPARTGASAPAATVGRAAVPLQPAKPGVFTAWGLEIAKPALLTP
ncbi:MAG TPA: cell wall hydrolase [Caulobacteraceae bacterium]